MPAGKTPWPDRAPGSPPMVSTALGPTPKAPPKRSACRLIAALAIGRGKTTVSEALTQSGLRVQGITAGADSIDSGWHAWVTGRASWRLHRNPGHVGRWRHLEPNGSWPAPAISSVRPIRRWCSLGSNDAGRGSVGTGWWGMGRTVPLEHRGWSRPGVKRASPPVALGRAVGRQLGGSGRLVSVGGGEHRDHARPNESVSKSPLAFVGVTGAVATWVKGAGLILPQRLVENEVDAVVTQPC